MNIACVLSVESHFSVEKPLPTQKEIPFGISFVATVLKEAGHEVEMLVFTGDTPVAKTLETFIARFCPRLFCLTAVTTQMPLITRVADEIKRIDPSAYVLLGGHHASFNPEECIVLPAVDAICVGEGEGAVLEIAARLDAGERPEGILNLWIKNGETVQRNGTRPFESDLDGLPHIDRSLWLPWIHDPDRMPSLLLGRGCPFKCTYCSNHVSRKLAEGRYVRFRSPDDICAEIRELRARFPRVREIYLEVETFGAHLRYSHQLCEALERLNREGGEPTRFGVNLAVTKKVSTDEHLLEALKRAGFTFLNIGLESGSERVRREILDRPKYSNDDIVNFCRLAGKHGLSINMFVLLGLPGETVEDFKKTVKVVRACRPGEVFLSIFHPYPGTKLHEASLPFMTTKATDTKRERVVATMSLPGFSKRQITRENILFYYHVYKGIWPMSAIARKVLYMAAATYPVLKPLTALLPLGARVKRMARRLRGIAAPPRPADN